MRYRTRPLLWGALLTGWLCGTMPLAAQRRVASTTEAEPEVRVTVHLRDVRLQDALTSISKAGRVDVSFSATTIPADRRVSVSVDDVPVSDAIRQALMGTDIKITRVGGKFVLYREEASQQGDIVIRGRVVEAKTQRPVRTATISVDGVAKAVTRDDGTFQITKVSPGPHVISVRLLGFASVKRPVTVDGSAAVTLVAIALDAAPTTLTEVVTTGAGDRQRVEVGNSIATINADSVVATTPIRNISDLLAGRVSGLDVLTSSGTVGSGSKIRIRGLSSIVSGSDPIVIVDGVRYNAAYTNPVSGSVTGSNSTIPPSLNQAGSGASVPATSRLDDIDPNSIESVDVLKGPAASALYGSDAANGVIVIKTKHGKAGPTRWNVNGDLGTSRIDATFADNYFGWGKLVDGNLPSPSSCTLAYVGSLYCSQDSLSHFNPLNYGPTSPFRTGNSQRLNGQVSGGSDRVQYFVNSTYDNELGDLRFPPALRTLTDKLLNGNPIPSYANQPNLLNSVSIASSLTTQFTKGDIALNTNGMRQYHRDVPEGQSGFIAAAEQSPGYLDTLTYGWGSTTPANTFLTRNDEVNNHGWGSLSGNWRPTSQLTLHATGGIDLSSNDAQTLLTQNDILPGFSSNSSQRSRAQTTNFVKTADGNVTWTLPVNDRVRLVSTGGAQYTGTTTSSFNVTAYNLPLGSSTISGAGTINSSEYQGQAVTAGAYLQEVFSLNQRLFLTGAIRSDASSAFGSSSPVAYPKWNASWLISQEPFFPTIPGVSSLRLRAGFGHAGTQPSYDARFKTYQYIQGVADGSVLNTIGINTVGNPDLQPEKSVETEGGFDLSLGNDRVTLGMTLESKMTQNALVNRSLPPSLGVATSEWQNIGKVANHSFEIDASAHPIDLRAFDWTTTFTYSHQTNKLVTLNSTTPPPTGTAGGNLTYYLPGYPLDAVWARALLGYNDTNGDGIVEANELRATDSLAYAGRSSPPNTLGWQNSVALWSGRLTVSGNFTYEDGATQTNTLLQQQCAAGLCRGAVDPHASLSDQILAQSTSLTQWGFLEQVSVFRFNEMTISLTMPPSLARALHAQNASVAILGRNLKVWSHYRGVDPDVNSTPNGNAVVDAGNVPQPREWYLRVRLGF
jgi:TonB-linked SusC/RagA family outer membrane protein